MRRALRRAVGVLLAAGIVGLAQPALAQTSSYQVRSPQTPVSAVQYEGTTAVKPDSSPGVAPIPTTNLNRSAISWESEVKAKPKGKGVTIQVTPPEPAKEKTGKPARMSKPDIFASTPRSADALTAPTPPKKWNQPMPWDSETPAKVAAPPTMTPMKMAPVAPAAPAISPAVLSSTGAPSEIIPRRPVPAPAPARPAPPTDASALRPARRWPPAYAAAPIESNKGRPGVIVFEDEPASKFSASAAQPSTTGVFRPIVPTDLQAKVRAVCGRQARDVSVEMQRDGSVLVKVKVASASAERQLPSKILTIPEMAASNVHLATVSEP